MFRLVLVLVVVAVANGQKLFLGDCPDVTVQENFTIPEYMGKWYEVKRFPTFFEFLADCVTANYTLQDDGTVLVENTGCNKITREYSSVDGVASQNPDEPAKLKIKFPQCACADSCSSIGSLQDLRTGSANFFPRIDDSHCERIHSSLTADHFFDDGYMGKQPVAWKEYSSKLGDYWVISTDYESYSIVWSCYNVPILPWNFQLAWILTREPEGLEDEAMNRIDEILTINGIDKKAFKITSQVDCPERLNNVRRIPLSRGQNS